MRVKMLVDCYSYDFKYQYKAGKTYDVPTARAEKGIELGYCEPLPEKAIKQSTKKQIETAMKKKEENERISIN